MSNWQLIITLATLVFAIFGANWLSLQLLRSYLDARIDTIRAEIETIRVEGRAEARIIFEKVDRIDKSIQRLYQPIPPPGQRD